MNYLLNRRTFNIEYYAKLLNWFNEDLKKEEWHLAKQKMLLQQDNARMPTYPVGRAKWNELD